MIVVMKSRRAEVSGQQGFVSIFAVLIIMSVLTLIAIGFSMVSRQAEKNTLDDQLNTQAFYAAESGINDVSRIVDAAASGSRFEKPDCDGNLMETPAGGGPAVA